MRRDYAVKSFRLLAKRFYAWHEQVKSLHYRSKDKATRKKLSLQQKCCIINDILQKKSSYFRQKSLGKNNNKKRERKNRKEYSQRVSYKVLRKYPEEFYVLHVNDKRNKYCWRALLSPKGWQHMRVYVYKFNIHSHIRAHILIVVIASAICSPIKI